METIEFKYCFKEDDEVKEVKICKKDKDGITCGAICDLFLDFMTSAGFMEETIYKFFQER